MMTIAKRAYRNSVLFLGNYVFWYDEELYANTMPPYNLRHTILRMQMQSIPDNIALQKLSNCPPYTECAHVIRHDTAF